MDRLPDNWGAFFFCSRTKRVPRRGRSEAPDEHRLRLWLRRRPAGLGSTPPIKFRRRLSTPLRGTCGPPPRRGCVSFCPKEAPRSRSRLKRDHGSYFNRDQHNLQPSRAGCVFHAILIGMAWNPRSESRGIRRLKKIVENIGSRTSLHRDRAGRMLEHQLLKLF